VQNYTKALHQRQGI